MNRCALMLFVCFTISPQKRNARRSPAKCRDLLEFCRLPRKSTEPKRKPGNVEKKKRSATRSFRAVPCCGSVCEHGPRLRKLPLTALFHEVRGFAAGSRRFEKRLNLMCGGHPPPTPTNIYASKAPVHHFLFCFLIFSPFGSPKIICYHEKQPT